MMTWGGGAPMIQRLPQGSREKVSRRDELRYHASCEEEYVNSLTQVVFSDRGGGVSQSRPR